MYAESAEPSQPRSKSVQYGAHAEACLEPVRLQRQRRGQKPYEVDNHVAGAERINPLTCDVEEDRHVIFDWRCRDPVGLLCGAGKRGNGVRTMRVVSGILRGTTTHLVDQAEGAERRQEEGAECLPPPRRGILSLMHV